MELDIFVNDILNLFQDYKIEKHTDDEKGYEFLDVGHYFLTIKNPEGASDLSIKLGKEFVLSMQFVFAAEEVTLWSRFKDIMKDFYLKLLGISTIVAVTMAAVALVIRMVSRNQKAVDEASAWLKRIVITWIMQAIARGITRL